MSTRLLAHVGLSWIEQTLYTMHASYHTGVACEWRLCFNIIIIVHVHKTTWNAEWKLYNIIWCECIHEFDFRVKTSFNLLCTIISVIISAGIIFSTLPCPCTSWETSTKISERNMNLNADIILLLYDSTLLNMRQIYSHGTLRHKADLGMIMFPSTLCCCVRGVSGQKYY